MKITNYLKLILAALLVVLAGAIVLSMQFKVNSANLSDPQDIFFVQSPRANTDVTGATEVKWKAFDDEQNNIQFTAKLYDKETCSKQDYGSITTSTSVKSSETEDFSLQWNSQSTQTVSNLTDDTYCLKICLALINEGSPYSACNSRLINIFNNNSKPEITSNPSKTTVEEGGKFQYQVTASDKDGDKLTYRFIKSASFLQINQETGLITSTEISLDGKQELSFDIAVEVSDGKNGSSVQNFTLKIVPKGQSSSDSDPDTTLEVEILKPSENDNFSGKENKIQWTEVKAEDAAKILLSYSTDQKDWKIIATIANSDNFFVWDVSEITDGQYYIKLDALKDDDTSAFHSVSSKFNISNEIDGETETDSIPLIVQVEPENDLKITAEDFKNVIVGEFIASQGAEILPDTFRISLNDNDVTEICEVGKEGFLCSLTEKLKVGRQLIKITVKDSNDKEAKYESVFSIISLTSSPVSGANGKTLLLFGQEVPQSAVYIIILLCCLTSIILFIPWFLYFMWSGSGGERTIKKETYISDNYQFPAQSAETFSYNPAAFDMSNVPQQQIIVEQPAPPAVAPPQELPPTPLDYYEPQATDEPKQ